MELGRVAAIDLEPMPREVSAIREPLRLATARPVRPAKREPLWPDLPVIDPARVRVSYWLERDMLVVDFFGPDPGAVAIPLDEAAVDLATVFLKIDPASSEIVGLQVSDLFSRVAPRHPAFLDLLDLAELHGITQTEIAAWRRALAPAQRTRTILAACIDELFPLSA